MSDSATPVWLVTGAAGALGSALVRRLLEDGADCIALDRRARELDALHDELHESLGRAPALMPMDLAGAGPEDYQQLAEVIESQFGRVDVLVHNAAAFQALRPMLQQQPGEWLETLQTSLTAPYMLSAVLAPLMGRDSRIVFVGDRHCLEHPGGWGAFGVAQAGRRQMARILEADRARNQPRVIEVDPGPFYSRLRVAAWPSDSPENLPDAATAADKVIAAVADAADTGKPDS